MKKFYIAKSRRLRSTPYTSRIAKQGVTSYSIYNHIYKLEAGSILTIKKDSLENPNQDFIKAPYKKKI